MSIAVPIFLFTVSPAGSVVVTPTINSQQLSTEMLTCLAMGGPGNVFTWTKFDDGSVVNMTADISIMVMDASDGGAYQCSVTNSAGNDTAQTVVNGKIFTEPHKISSITKMQCHNCLHIFL